MSGKSFIERLRQEATDVILERDHTIPPRVRFSGVLVTSKASEWGKPKRITGETSTDGDHFNAKEITVMFRTKFDLYRSEGTFYLHKLGEADYDKYRTFFTVISFESPDELKKIIEDPSDKRLHASRPLIELIEAACESPWLSEDEKPMWKDTLLVGTS